jgi:DNA invertase Pin-like site-specific DNA recombinase
MKTCRIYQRVSTEGQDLTRQHKLIADAEAAGYYVAGVYSEKVSGTKEDRPELNRLIADLQKGDVIIAEHLDRLTRLPMDRAEALMATIEAKGARVSVPGLVDLPKVGEGVADIVMKTMQAMLLKIALYQCRQDYETRRQRQAEGIERTKASDALLPLEQRKNKGRKPDVVANAKIVELRRIGYTIAKIASTLNVSESQVKLILKREQTEAVAA